MPNVRQELLPLVVQENSVMIDASLLHKKLKIQTPFHTWVKRRIEEYGFEKDKDFCTNLSKSTGGRQAVNYLLSIDMAKELAMVERNDTGRTIRRYFIEKEKELRGLVHLPAAAALFRGLRPRLVNDRRMYPYQPILERCGYSTRSSSSQRRAKYWQHFIKDGRLLFITEELALHLHHQRQVIQNRVKLKEMQPVLPMDFGTSTIFSNH